MGKLDLLKVTPLKNTGNTCYMNASIQCIFNCIAFTNNILQLNCPVYLDDEHTKVNPLYMYRQTLIDYFDEQTGSLGPSMFKNLIAKHDSGFVGSRQQDSNEFFVKFLDIMDEEFKKQHKNNSKLENLMVNYFDSKIVQVLKCNMCGHESRKNCEDRYLTLPIINKNGKNVKTLNTFEQAKQHYFSVEQLDENNKWECDKCKQKSRAFKSLQINNTPHYLVIQLKRFDYLNNRAVKLNFPVEMEFDINVNNKYGLIGIVFHMGGPGGGHYNAMIFKNGKWYICDDLRISEVSKDYVKERKNTGYMYIYEKYP